MTLYEEFEKSIEISKNHFGKNKHRAYHPISKIRMYVHRIQLPYWFMLWAKDKEVKS
jgi:hypothetical protein